jgi:hypothetical protein
LAPGAAVEVEDENKVDEDDGIADANDNNLGAAEAVDNEEDENNDVLGAAEADYLPMITK